MRPLALLCLVLTATAGQCLAQATPAAAPASASAEPPPDWHTITYDFMYSACLQEASCGCSKGVEACVDMLVKAGLSAPTLACIAHEPCAVLCENENAGQPGTKLHANCLTDAARSAARAHFTAQARVASCATGRRCGCEPRSVEACVADMARSPDVSGHFWACVASQPCADFCDPDTTKPGGGIHTRCMLPSTAKARALSAKTLQDTLKLNSAMQQRMHETTMGIIRNMAPTPARVDVYDAQGNYIRSK